MIKKFYPIFAVLVFLSCANFTLAEELNSPDFKILNSSFESGVHSTSTSFQLYGSFSNIGMGTSTSADYSFSPGALPVFISTPVVSVTSGANQVSLSWVDGSDLGVVANYSVGKSEVPGGPYSYVTVGKVYNYTAAGLSAGRTYYFVVRSENSSGGTLAVSFEISATTALEVGGGGGGPVSIGSIVRLSGWAYPGSVVTLLKDSQVAATAVAGVDAKFDIMSGNLSPGNYVFSVYAVDSNGVKSSMFNFPVQIAAGSSAYIGGIYIAPSVGVDKPVVKKGENLVIFGQSAPNSEVVIQVNSDRPMFYKTRALASGIYLYNLDTSELKIGDYYAKTKSFLARGISSFSQVVDFKIGLRSQTKNEAGTPVKCNSDFNNDGKIGLIDFNVMSYWWKRMMPLPILEIIDMNNDGELTLPDFSILAHCWSG